MAVDDLVTTAEDVSLSRRRVLTGVAWTVRAVVIATSTPAIASSMPRPGGLALTSVSSQMDPTSLFVRGTLAYTGDASDVEVTDIVVTVRFPKGRYDGATFTPTVSGAGWSYVSSKVEGADRVVTIKWTGSPLIFTNSASSPFVLTIPKKASRNFLTVTLGATGMSGGAAVPPPSAFADVVNVATWGFVTGAANIVTYLASFKPHGDAANMRCWRIRGNVRWTGPTASTSRAAGAPVTGVQVVVRVPDTLTTGARYNRTATSVGAGWTLVGAPVHSGGEWVVTYAYSGTLQAGAAATTALDFIMQVQGTQVANAVQISATGTCAGRPVSLAFAGPPTV